MIIIGKIKQKSLLNIACQAKPFPHTRIILEA